MIKLCILYKRSAWKLVKNVNYHKRSTEYKQYEAVKITLNFNPKLYHYSTEINFRGHSRYLFNSVHNKSHHTGHPTLILYTRIYLTENSSTELNTKTIYFTLSISLLIKFSFIIWLLLFLILIRGYFLAFLKVILDKSYLSIKNQFDSFYILL